MEERQRLSQQLGSLLKGYFPLMMELFPRKLSLMTAVIKHWGSLEKLKRVHPKTLRTFLKENGMRDQDKQTEVFDAVRSAVPLTRDKAIIEPNAVYAQMLAGQIQALSNTIEQLEGDIAIAVAAHPDNKIFRALPGAGDALVPRLIAAFGSDRDRYDSAEDIQWHRPGDTPKRKNTARLPPPRLPQIPEANLPRVRRPCPQMEPLVGRIL